MRNKYLLLTIIQTKLTTYLFSENLLDISQNKPTVIYFNQNIINFPKFHLAKQCIRKRKEKTFLNNQTEIN